MTIAYLGLGSNMGDRRAHIKAALQFLNKNKIKVSKVSRLIETKPVGGPPQADYLNGAVRVETKLKPLALLKQLKKIEDQLGRVKTLHFGPRPIDIDILLYGNVEIKNKGLQIPHPQIRTRGFVKRSLQEIRPT